MRKPPECSGASMESPMWITSCRSPPGKFQGKAECVCMCVALVGNAAARTDIQRFGQHRDLVSLRGQVALEAFQIVQRGAVVVCKIGQPSLDDDLGRGIAKRVGCNRFSRVHSPSEIVKFNPGVAVEYRAEWMPNTAWRSIMLIKFAHDGYASLHVGCRSVGVREGEGNFLRFVQSTLRQGIKRCGFRGIAAALSQVGRPPQQHSEQ